MSTQEFGTWLTCCGWLQNPDISQTKCQQTAATMVSKWWERISSIHSIGRLSLDASNKVQTVFSCDRDSMRFCSPLQHHSNCSGPVDACSFIVSGWISLRLSISSSFPQSLQGSKYVSTFAPVRPEALGEGGISTSRGSIFPRTEAR